MDERLKMLLERYGGLCEELEPLKELLDNTRAEIARLVLEQGEPVKYRRVSVTIRAGYTKVTWNTKALEGFAAAHPELLKLRSESEVQPGVTIKILKEGGAE